MNYGALPFALINAVKEIASISDTFQQNLIAWLGNASNGITDLYASIVHTTQVISNEDDTQKLCVGVAIDFCGGAVTTGFSSAISSSSVRIALRRRSIDRSLPPEKYARASTSDKSL